MLVRDDSAKGDIDIGRYYAARGKLVGVDEEHEGHTAPVSASCRGDLDIVDAQLAVGPGETRRIRFNILNAFRTKFCSTYTREISQGIKPTWLPRQLPTWR